MAELRSGDAAPAPIEQRVAAVEWMLQLQAREAGVSVDGLIAHADAMFDSGNGARVVARAWTDPEFRARLLADGRMAVAELGIIMPVHHRQLMVLENTTAVQNVMVCSLCSCTAMSVIGAPPDWYKDFAYRARVVRESRTVLREMGCDLPDEVEIRIWDTTADTRYMVLPVQPPHTMGWPEDRLAEVVTRDSLIGVARL